MVISADQAEKMCGLAMTVPAAQDSISKFVKINILRPKGATFCFYIQLKIAIASQGVETS